MAQPFLGEIKIVAFNFPPKGWVFCNGQLLPINQNQALFSLLGTTYGGNGQTTFALPNMQGRTPMHFGSGPAGTAGRAGAGSDLGSYVVPPLSNDNSLAVPAALADYVVAHSEVSSSLARGNVLSALVGNEMVQPAPDIDSNDGKR